LLFKCKNDFYAKYLSSIFAIVGGYSALFVFDSFFNHQHKTVCLFKLATGIPCGGCGMGRATLEIMKGNFVSSFEYHILCIPFTFAIFISLIWMFIDVLQKKERFFPFINSKLRMPYIVLFFLLFAVSWLTNIIRQV